MKNTQTFRHLLSLIAFAILAGACGKLKTFQPQSANLAHTAGGHSKVLIFTKTQGFRHDGSIQTGTAALKTLIEKRGLTPVQSEDSSLFTEEGLHDFKAVIFLSTTGDVLNATQKKAFEKYIEEGGGFIGIHAASDRDKNWKWYGDLIGAYFAGHPAVQQADVLVLDRDHPSTKTLPQKWTRTDEWYDFDVNPRGNVHVLAVLEEKTYNQNLGKEQWDQRDKKPDHPISWCQSVKSGRSFYTGMGHTSESFEEDNFLKHLDGALGWAAGLEEGDCSATITKNLVATTLVSDIKGPMEMALTNDNRVFFIERKSGKVRIYDPLTAATTDALVLSTTSDVEDGMMGITLDPDFDKNGWLYIYWSQKNQPVDRLSRFTATGRNSIDRNSERIILEVPVDRNTCCHSGGSLAFGPSRELFLSVGDNTNPFESDGFGPFDDNPGRIYFDASRSAGNTNDLRGKILRIVPTDSGDQKYTIPSGNLFAPGTPKTRPEIYTMGLRNPFRISVDKRRGWLIWGDVGPDSGNDDTGPETKKLGRGKKGYDEVNLAKKAGNFGWPFVNGNNSPYRRYNFGSFQNPKVPDVVGDFYNPNAPVNDRRNNTGLIDLPPAIPAWIYYYAFDYDHFEMDPMYDEETLGGKTAMGGPFYNFNPSGTSLARLPKYYDGKVFVYDWSRNLIRTATMDAEGNLIKLTPFRVYDAARINTANPIQTFNHPIDIEISNDGHMYVLNYGLDWEGKGGPEASLVRIDFLGGKEAPLVAKVSADKTSGSLPLTVQFSSAGTIDPAARGTLEYSWDINGDGIEDSKEANPRFNFQIAGEYLVTMTVRSVADRSRSAKATMVIYAGNSAPEISLAWPLHGSFFDFGDSIPYEVKVSDKEDPTIDFARLSINANLGHDTHAHGLEVLQPLSGIHKTISETGHASEDDIYYLLTASYTDGGFGNVSALNSRAVVKLNTRRKEMELASQKFGPIAEPVIEGEPGHYSMAFIEHGHWVMFDVMNFVNMNKVKYRVASAAGGGVIEMRLDSPTGQLVTTTDVPNTGSWQSWITVETPFNDPIGSHPVYFVFKGPGGLPVGGNLFNVNWVEFEGQGATVRSDLGSNSSVKINLVQYWGVYQGRHYIEIYGDFPVGTQAELICDGVKDSAADTPYKDTRQINMSFDSAKPRGSCFVRVSLGVSSDQKSVEIPGNNKGVGGKEPQLSLSTVLYAGSAGDKNYILAYGSFPSDATVELTCNGTREVSASVDYKGASQLNVSIPSSLRDRSCIFKVKSGVNSAQQMVIVPKTEKQPQ